MWGDVGHTGTVTGQCSMCSYITGTRACLGKRAPEMFQNMSSLYAFDAGCELLEAKRRELLI